MARLTYLLRGNTVGSSTWTAPAGVTQVNIQVMQGTTLYGQVRTLDVVPNTSYTVTIASTSWSATSNTFGSLFSWTGGGRIAIIWME